MTADTGDWLEKVFKDANDHMNSLPAWAKPVITRVPDGLTDEQAEAIGDAFIADVLAKDPTWQRTVEALNIKPEAL